jgi:Coenzyme PQQ synthesis protein D (PqqD)
MAEELFAADRVPARRLEARVRRSGGQTFVGLGQQAVELNEVGLFILKQIDGVSSMREIGQRVADAYQIPLDEAFTDSAELVAQLVAFGAVEARP